MMGSTYCKSPYSPKLPDLGKLFINCPLQFCFDMRKDAEPEVIERPRKYCSSDISFPLPLGTAFVPPKRPPRKRKCRISRCHSVDYLYKGPNSVIGIVRSNSAADLNFNKFNHTNNDDAPLTTSEVPKVHLSPLIVPVGDFESRMTASNLECQVTTAVLLNSTPKPMITLSSPPSVPMQQQLTLNKRTFLAGLLEQNNNNIHSEVKDITTSRSRRSSFSESLREFESSLYDMLQDNAEDERSEHSLHLTPSHVISR